ncbi:MAG: TIGR01244 family phosphatase [Rhizobiales bacterium]|nr:TIGR01244 family phosphatase [Hyphomicrobiales bacterium]MBA69837.1 TIGR01244 family phosphatase [Hyphomicrobiales bacterium]
MDDIRQITEEYSVAGQISAEDLPALKQAGFRSIVCNRPDQEQPGQPTFDSIRNAAADLGMEARHIPVGGMGLTPEAVTQMVDALEEMEKPMLGYCRSGARSTVIYQQSERLRGG